MSILLNPLFALVCYGLAVATAALLVRLPFIRQHLPGHGDRQTTVDGLRGYLALGVFIHHLVIYYPYLHSGTFQLPPSILYTQLGRTSVALFFMITSFLFWSRVLTEGIHLNWFRFAIGRLARIYPLYLTVLALLLLIAFAEADWQLLDAPTELIVSLGRWLIFQRPPLNDLNSSGDMIANVTWTLSYELLFYLMLPALTLTFVNRRSWLQGVLGLAFIYLLYKITGASSAHKISVLSSFLGGIAAAHWIRCERRRKLAQSRKMAAIALLLIFGVLLGSPSTFSLTPLAVLTIAFCIIASGNDLFGALRPNALRWLGEISYSTYLLHGMLLWTGLKWMPRLLETDPREIPYYLGFAALTTPVLILLSSATYLLIEQPGITAGRWLANLLKPGANSKLRARSTSASK